MENIIIVGSGIAGLYAAYKIRKLHPIKTIKILEANGKKDIGGRMGTELFQGNQVVTGAGIGRKRKDKLLIELLNELEVPYEEFPSKHYYVNTLDCNVRQVFFYLREQYNKEKPIKKTFKEFAESILGKQEYINFITCAGFTDYENEDVYDTLYNYGFNDIYENWIGLSIPWTKLTVALIKKIGMETIDVNTRVEKIEEITCNYYRIHTNKKTYACNQVIIATTIDTVRKLLPTQKIYKEIEGQPFIRVYGKFSKTSIPIIMRYLKGFTIIPGPLQKIIPIHPSEGIYMIAYADNKQAKYLHRLFLNGNGNTVENREKFVLLLKQALGIPKEEEIHLSSILEIYWEIGTHYYKPLDPIYKSRKEFIKSAQYPNNNIFVIGEMVSTNQGWVEGALESVEAIL